MRVDAQGNPLVHVTGCPNCGDGEGWMTQAEYGGGAVKPVRIDGTVELQGSDFASPCSRRCELQLEHARSLARQEPT